MAKITLRELAKREGQDFFRLYNWVKRGWLPAKKRVVEVDYVKSNGNAGKKKMEVWVVDEQDWFEIPTWVRKRNQKK